MAIVVIIVVVVVIMMMIIIIIVITTTTTSEAGFCPAPESKTVEIYLKTQGSKTQGKSTEQMPEHTTCLGSGSGPEGRIRQVSE